MKAPLLILLFSVINISLSIYVYNPTQVINFFSGFTAETASLQFIIDSLKKTFNDAYAFIEISKNPPNKPENYFKKINFENELSKIDISGNLYFFYQGLKKALFAYEDLHINIDLETILQAFTLFYFNHPLKLYIQMYDNKPRIFGKPYHSSDIWPYFENYENLYLMINNNLDVPIKSINGQDPFDFITNIGKGYFGLKSPQSAFIYNYFNHNNNISFYDLPYSVDELTEFTVVYDNQDSFTTQYIVTSDVYLNQMNTNLNLRNLLMNNILKKENNIKENNPLFHNNILIKNELKNNNDAVNETIDEEFKWDFNYYNIFKCRVDEKNNIDVIYISSFGSQNDLNNLLNMVAQCILLFDNNDYPINLILSFNGGGQAYLSQELLDLLSPKVNFNIYCAYRKTENFKYSEELNSFFSSYYFSSETCEPLTYDYLVKKEHLIDYGNNISDTLTETFILFGKQYKEQINSIKKNLKNPRKPTDIIVFTDGFSYSAADIFLKYFQYYGGG